MSGDGSSQGRRPVVAGSGLQIGRVLGVPIVVQPLWFVIVIVIAFTFGPEVQRRAPALGDTAAYVVALLFAVLLYASVLIHEIGHVVVAKSLGMEVRRIVLQPLGGVSEVVEERPGKPSRESLVAVVGPMTSLVLGLAGLVIAQAFRHGTVPWVLA